MKEDLTTTALSGKIEQLPAKPAQNRVSVIEQLLERYHELVDPMRGPGGVKGDGESLPLMPTTYTSSVKELERLLAILREERRSQWWHVTERYLRSSWVTRDVPTKMKTRKGKTTLVPIRTSVRVEHPAVRNSKVTKGLAWLSDNWALGHEPMLPKELRVTSS